MLMSDVPMSPVEAIKALAAPCPGKISSACAKQFGKINPVANIDKLVNNIMLAELNQLKALEINKPKLAMNNITMPSKIRVLGLNFFNSRLLIETPIKYDNPTNNSNCP